MGGRHGHGAPDRVNAVLSALDTAAHAHTPTHPISFIFVVVVSPGDSRTSRVAPSTQGWGSARSQVNENEKTRELFRVRSEKCRFPAEITGGVSGGAASLPRSVFSAVKCVCV